MIVYDTKSNLPAHIEIQQAMGISFPTLPTIAGDIWMELQTVKQVGTHTLKIMITDNVPDGQCCISSDMSPGYKFIGGQLYGEQIITVCSHYYNCPYAGRVSFFKCGCYLYSIRKSPDCT